MSERFHITFDPGMPPASAEVLSDSFQTLATVWVEPGERAEVRVPAVADVAVVQVLLASGEQVSARPDGSAEVTVRRAPSRRPAFRTVDTLQAEPESNLKGRLMDAVSALLSSGLRVEDALGAGASEVGSLPDLGDVFQAIRKGQERRKGRTSRSPGDPAPAPQAGSGHAREARPHVLTALRVEMVRGGEAPVRPVEEDPKAIVFDEPGGYRPLDLTITDRDDDDCRLRVRLPGSLATARIRAGYRDGGPSLFVSVATHHREADVLSTYLHRGDLRAAAAIVPTWEQDARRLLREKAGDPAAAAIGGYLLLRLRRFDLMRDWARNLAHGWPDLPDGAVIWGWQCVHERRAEEAARYLFQAADADVLPVFTEGLRLLADGLRLLGEGGAKRLADLEKRVGVVQWESPFTAWYPRRAGLGPVGRALDIAYEAGRSAVESSAFESIGYDAELKRLEVEFDSGAVYEFWNVSAETYEALQRAESVGSFFNEHVRSAGYPSNRLR